MLFVLFYLFISYFLYFIYLSILFILFYYYNGILVGNVHLWCSTVQVFGCCWCERWWRVGLMLYLTLVAHKPLAFLTSINV